MSLTEIRGFKKPGISGEEFHWRVTPLQSEIRSARKALHQKAGCILGCFFISYATLLNRSVATPVRVVSFLVVLIALTMVATSIMHDANHGAFFEDSPKANAAVGYLGDLLGVSSALWRIKHNLHHTDTNVQGADPDLDQGLVARLAPAQPLKPWHRWQHRYLWVLYGFMGIQWLLISDFVDLARGRVAGQSIGSIGLRTRISIIAGKVLHVSWALILPMLLFPWRFVIPVYLVGSWLIGTSLAATFQIAHCVDIAGFSDVTTELSGDGMVWHQLRTTADVRQRTSLLGRFRSVVVGGLDFQIEHHLAPHIPHTAYKRMAVQLREVCANHDIAYLAHDGVVGAVKSHQRWLRVMGRNSSD